MTATLASETAAVRGELARVDSKCGTLTGLAGAALAFIVSQAGHGHPAVQVTTSAAGLAFASATLLLLDVLRPRLGQTGFRRYAAMTSAQISRYFTATDPDGITAEDLQVLSVIVNRKYERLTRATQLMTAGVALLSVALIVQVIA